MDRVFWLGLLVRYFLTPSNEHMCQDVHLEGVDDGEGVGHPEVGGDVVEDADDPGAAEDEEQAQESPGLLVEVRPETSKKTVNQK